MNGLWPSLLPFILGGAFVPIQLVITILLLRSGRGPVAAAGFVGGMTAVRLAQGLVFGLVIAGSDMGTTESGSSGSSPVVSGVLVTLALVLYAAAVKQFTADDDPDAPPPKWITMTETMTAAKAFVLGVGLLAIGAKFWVFTLGAIGVIGDADLSRTSSILTFIAFVFLTEVLHLVILGVALVMPGRSAAALDRTAGWLKDHNRVIVIVLSMVFGTWFLLKGLDGLGVL